MLREGLLHDSTTVLYFTGGQITDVPDMEMPGCDLSPQEPAAADGLSSPQLFSMDMLPPFRRRPPSDGGSPAAGEDAGWRQVKRPRRGRARRRDTQLQLRNSELQLRAESQSWVVMNCLPDFPFVRGGIACSTCGCCCDTRSSHRPALLPVSCSTERQDQAETKGDCQRLACC